MNFLPDNYQVPQNNGGNHYFKPPKGSTKVRILSSPIMGYIQWNDKVPTRSKSELNDSKHFWALKIYNHANGEVQIWEVTQVTIQQQLALLAKSEWGNPKDYDINIIKSGSDMETTYQVQPVPPAPLSPEVQSKVNSVYVDLEKLYSNEDPFSTDGLPEFVTS